MNLRGVRDGDVVRLVDDSSLWIVTGRDGPKLVLRIPRGSLAIRRAGAREVVEAWRKVGRR